MVTTLEWVTDGLLASGTISAPWRAECTRCLGPAEGHVDFEFRELFEKVPREGESYRLGHDSIDMEPLVREQVLLELPLVPLCAADCQGLCATCGADLNQGECGCDRDRGRPPVGGPGGFPGRAPARRDIAARPGRVRLTLHGCPQEEDVKGQEPQSPGIELAPGRARPEHLPPVPPGQDAPRGLPQLRVVRRAPSHRSRLARLIRRPA